ncbi:Bone Morphogenetic Protein 6 [Manis pentadactyla]|nr:Bone Morphogenetic Protein 6 [Manis pentadactyla]
MVIGRLRWPDWVLSGKGNDMSICDSIPRKTKSLLSSLSLLYTFGSRHLTGQQDSLQGHGTFVTCIEGPAWDCS